MPHDRDALSWDGAAGGDPQRGVEREQQPGPAAVRTAVLAMASHELRTPIQALRLNVAMMRTRTEATADEVPRRWLAERLQRTQRLVDQMARIVDALLNMAEITSGHLELRRESLDLAALARGVVADADERLRWAGTPCDVDAPEPVVGCWDRFRLATVVENLLANAMKYAAGSPIHVRVRAAGEDAVLAVADEGPGIAPEDRARVFEQFERGAPRDGVGGFGLGLWIVRTVAEAHGGWVALSCERGATFTVLLPRGSARAPAGAP